MACHFVGNQPALVKKRDPHRKGNPHCLHIHPNADAVGKQVQKGKQIKERKKKKVKI